MAPHDRVPKEKVPRGWTNNKNDIGTELDDVPFDRINLPPAKRILFNNETDTFLMESDGRYMFWNEITDNVVEIVEPKDLSAIVTILPDDEKLETIPLIWDGGNILMDQQQPRSKDCPRGWSDQPFVLDIINPPAERYGLGVVEKVLYSRDISELIFKCDEKFYAYHWPSEVLKQVMDPTTREGIYKWLAAGEKLTTGRLEIMDNAESGDSTD